MLGETTKDLYELVVVQKNNGKLHKSICRSLYDDYMVAHDLFIDVHHDFDDLNDELINQDLLHYDHSLHNQSVSEEEEEIRCENKKNLLFFAVYANGDTLNSSVFRIIY